MSRLCGDLHSALTPCVLRLLFNKSIFTNLAFVRTDSELLAKISSLEYHEILQIKNKILTKFSSTLKSGNKYYKQFLSQCAFIPTGIDNFDKLLDSGLMTGHLYEICGFTGSGKSQICMTIAANVAVKSTHEVLYIDSKNDICTRRLCNIIGRSNSSNIGENLRKIKIVHVSSLPDLLQTLYKIDNSTKPYRLIIIDSLSSLSQQLLDYGEGQALLNNIAALLKYICIKYHIVILVVNYVSSWSTQASGDLLNGDEDQLGFCHKVEQPALGRFWAHVPNCRVMVKKLKGLNECFLIILKSFNQPVGKSVKVKLGDFGVI